MEENALSKVGIEWVGTLQLLYAYSQNIGTVLEEVEDDGRGQRDQGRERGQEE